MIFSETESFNKLPDQEILGSSPEQIVGKKISFSQPRISKTPEKSNTLAFFFVSNYKEPIKNLSFKII